MSGYQKLEFCLKQGRKISDFCLKQGQGMRGQATPPHPSIYQVPPPPTPLEDVPLENLTFHYINPAKQWNYIEMHAASIGENTTPKSKNLRVH